MAIGKIVSFFNGLSSSDQASAVDGSDSLLAGTDGWVDNTDRSDTHKNRDSGSVDPSAMAQQLGVMINSVQQLNSTAMEQGAAASVSNVGTQLKNAVTGLGHILSSVNPGSVTEQVARQIKKADEVIDAVESGLAGTQASTETVLRNLPMIQAMAAQEAAQKFQTEMHQAIDQVRGGLAVLRDW